MLYNLIWYFLIYAFLGWCLEVAYKAVTVGTFVNRGFLNGPVCPIYGTGMVLIILALTPIADKRWMLFLGSVVVCSAIEWLVGFVLEKAFHAKWWDYSDVPFNLNGYICLKFSLYWGLAGLFVMEIVHPSIAWMVGKIPHTFGLIAGCVLVAVMAGDATLTINTILKLNKELRELQELGVAMHRISDEIGENIFEGVFDLKVKTEKARVQLELAREELEARTENVREAAENARLEAREAATELVEDLIEKTGAMVGVHEDENGILRKED